MKIERLQENLRPHIHKLVRVKEMGNIIELMYQERENKTNVIKKISATEYIDIRTGEIKEFKPIANRSQALGDVRKSLQRLRDYINTNVLDVECCKWVTLTYKENMTDTKKLYEDFKNFIKRFKYSMKKIGYVFEYIVAMEPQGRGAWHAHVVFIFDSKAPFLDNNTFMAPLWGHGFTSVKKLDKNIDNLGAYLTAYLGDMDFEQFKDLDIEDKMEICEGNFICSDVEVDVEGSKISKRIIKGARMILYPPKFNLYRCSRGIKKPLVSKVSEFEAQKKVSTGILTFEKTIKLSSIEDSDNPYINHINYRYYNLKNK